MKTLPRRCIASNYRRQILKLDVRNGQRAMVEQVSPEGISVLLDDGQMIQINVKEYNHLDHGWAMKKGWSYNAAKDTMLEPLPLKQQQEIKTEMDQRVHGGRRL